MFVWGEESLGCRLKSITGGRNQLVKMLASAVLPAGSEREAELLDELKRVRESSANEIWQLKDKLDEALQVKRECLSHWLLCQQRVGLSNKLSRSF